jgi:hypothetical protein
VTHYSFTSSVVLPDGRSVLVAIDVPEGHASAHDPRDLADHTEFAQMTSAHALRILRSGDDHRARRDRDIADEMNAEIVAKLTERAPF